MPVFINNIDDYLGPSQACVNPLFAAPSTKPTQSAAADTSARADADAAPTNGPVEASNGERISGERAGSNARPKVDQNKRRTRPRRAPRIIRCEENESQTPGAGGPIRLARDDGGSGESHDAPAIQSATTQTIKKKATVTLSDCLSCSGCVTSAEAVLMSHHSIDKLREVSRSGQRKRIVFTISSASLADLYRHLYLDLGDSPLSGGDDVKQIAGPSRQEFLAKVASFLHSEFGAKAVVDGDITQKISLMESASEFCYRYKKSRRFSEGGKVSDDAKPNSKSLGSEMPSVALSSTRTRYVNKSPNGDSIVDDDTLMEVTTLSHPPGRLIDEEYEAHSVPASVRQSQLQSTSLPVLSSSCPGFVCLVEKTAPTAVPLLSSAKSPMAIAGTLLKTGQCNKHDRESVATSSYHVAIMPCHDKKLEAGRGDFAWERQALLRYGNPAKSAHMNKIESVTNDEQDLVSEVDLVLTTGELLEILGDAAAKRINSGPFATKLPDSPESIDSNSSGIRDMLTSCNLVNGSCSLMTATNDKRLNGNGRIDHLEVETGVHGSGSYADFIFRHAAQNLFECKMPRDKSLPWKSSTSSFGASSVSKMPGLIRRRRRRQETTDLREITLYKHKDGTYSCDKLDHSTPVLRFATAYGFKNVQLILQSLSKAQSSNPDGYDYVEVMACPSGCSNGGGQIGSNGRRETPREAKERVKKTVSTMPIIRPTDTYPGSLATMHCGTDPSLVNKSVLQSECFGKNARALFHTRFHVVPKLELMTGATAGVAVSDTNW